MKDQKNTYHEVFEVSSPEGLYKAVFSRINEENEKVIRRKKVFSYFFLGATSVGTLSAFIYAVAQFNQSGFYTYLSLMFTNIGNLGSYFGDLSMVLAESLPVFASLLFLSTLFVFILALMKFTKTKRQSYGFLYA